MDYSGLTVPKLRAKLKDLNLDTSGKKAELLERLEGATAPESQVLEEPEVLEKVDPTWTVPILRKKLEELGLIAKGKKQELIDRLQAAYSIQVPISEETDVIRPVDIIKEKSSISYKLKFPNITDNKNRTTVPILNRFEKARLIATRATQLAEGAIPVIKVPPNIIDLTTVAELEMKENPTEFPVKLVRPMRNREDEIWEYRELHDPFLNIF